ncbi:DUF2274 domain-containing protein [Sphingomonas sp. UYP23]
MGDFRQVDIRCRSPPACPLDAYGRANATADGSAELIAGLVPAMLIAFLNSDCEFAESLRSPSTRQS